MPRLITSLATLATIALAILTGVRAMNAPARILTTDDAERTTRAHVPGPLYDAPQHPKDARNGVTDTYQRDVEIAKGALAVAGQRIRTLETALGESEERRENLLTEYDRVRAERDSLKRELQEVGTSKWKRAEDAAQACEAWRRMELIGIAISIGGTLVLLGLLLFSLLRAPADAMIAERAKGAK